MTPHVIVDDGWLSYTVALCTVLAVFASGFSIWLSLSLARKADRKAVEERRRVFELGLLVRVAELVGQAAHRTADSNNACGLVLKALPTADFPTLRLMLGPPYLSGEDPNVTETFGKEFREAVDRRVNVI